MPIRHPGDMGSVVTSFETDIYQVYTWYIVQLQYKIPGTYAVYPCMWRLGCFPEAWRRGSYQLASLHLQSFMSVSHNVYILGDDKCAPGGTLVKDAPGGTLAYCAPGIT